MPTTDLASELAAAISAGLKAQPDLRAGLVSAVSACLGDQQGQMTKAEANYRPADNDQECCGHCSMFSNGNCSIVAGRIASHYTCDHYEPADSSGDPQADQEAARQKDQVDA